MAGYVSPFENGDWERWPNIERFNWLRALLKQIRERPKKIETYFEIDEAKIERLAEAVSVLESVTREEFGMLEKRVAYNKAMHELAMDEALRSGAFDRKGFPSIIPYRSPKRSGN